MLLPFVPQHYRRPGSRPRRIPPTATPPPPVASDSVVSVVIDSSNSVVVTLGANVESIDDPSLAMWVRHEGGAFQNGNSAELIDDTHVRISYDDDVSACTLWMIGDP